MKSLPTRNERLADHYLRVTGIAGVYIEMRGFEPKVGWLPVVTVARPPARTIFCVGRGNQALLVAMKLHEVLPQIADVPAAVVALRLAAAENGVGLTPHETVIDRANATVHEVNIRFEAMKTGWQLKSINRQFKAHRKAGGGGTYADFLHAKKVEALTALASVR